MDFIHSVQINHVCFSLSIRHHILKWRFKRMFKFKCAPLTPDKYVIFKTTYSCKNSTRVYVNRATSCVSHILAVVQPYVIYIHGLQQWLPTPTVCSCYQFIHPKGMNGLRVWRLTTTLSCIHKEPVSNTDIYLTIIVIITLSWWWNRQYVASYVVKKIT